MGASPQTPTALGRTRPTLPLVPRPAARREPRAGLQCKWCCSRATRAAKTPQDAHARYAAKASQANPWSDIDNHNTMYLHTIVLSIH